MPVSLARSIAAPAAKRIVPRPLREWIKDILNARRVRRNPGRIALVTEILPAYARLGGRILWIGCRRYTKNYGRLLSAHGGECWTTDIEPSHEKWGERGRHFTCDLVEIDRTQAPASFDTVLCNGVFGFGVDTPEMQLKALKAMSLVLKPGGRLLLGWNTERVADPTAMESAKRAFDADDPFGSGARCEIPEAGYVYAFLRRRGEENGGE
jgi:hypothetical protein